MGDHGNHLARLGGGRKGVDAKSGRTLVEINRRHHVGDANVAREFLYVDHFARPAHSMSGSAKR
jgi:hypothetical protein